MGAVCPICQASIPMARKPTSYRQAMWGGWTCQGCGTELDSRKRPIEDVVHTPDASTYRLVPGPDASAGRATLARLGGTFLLGVAWLVVCSVLAVMSEVVAGFAVVAGMFCFFAALAISAVITVRQARSGASLEVAATWLILDGQRVLFADITGMERVGPAVTVRWGEEQLEVPVMPPHAEAGLREALARFRGSRETAVDSNRDQQRLAQLQSSTGEPPPT